MVGRINFRLTNSSFSRARTTPVESELDFIAERTPEFRKTSFVTDDFATVSQRKTAGQTTKDDTRMADRVFTSPTQWRTRREIVTAAGCGACRIPIAPA